MFLHQTTVLVYPASIAYDEIVTCVGTTPHLKNAASASRHDSQETEMLDEDSEHRFVVDYSISPTLASHVLALTWQRDMWLHVAYGV